MCISNISPRNLFPVATHLKYKKASLEKCSQVLISNLCTFIYNSIIESTNKMQEHK